MNPHDIIRAISTFLLSSSETKRLTDRITLMMEQSQRDSIAEHIDLMMKQRVREDARLASATSVLTTFLRSLPEDHVCQYGDRILTYEEATGINVKRIFVVEEVYPRTFTTFPIPKRAIDWENEYA